MDNSNVVFLALVCLLGLAAAADHVVEIWPEDRLGHVNAGTVPNQRSRRATSMRRPIRISPAYDSSVTGLTPAKRQLVEGLIQEMVQYFSSIYSVNPATAPILVQRACQDGSFFPGLSNSTHVACDGGCAATTSCGGIPVQAKHLLACYTCTDQRKCQTLTGSQGQGSGEQNSDLLIYVGAKDEGLCVSQPATLGFALPCAMEAALDRPVFGALNLCPNRLMSSESDRARLVGVVRHEMYHVLAMNAKLFAFFRDENGQAQTLRAANGKPSQFVTDTSLGFSYTARTIYRWNSSTAILHTLDPWSVVSGNVPLMTYVMVTPKVRDFVRTHFNCPSLTGALLENQGGSGSAISHWEKRVFGNDVMTPTVTDVYSYSPLTMLLMEDSGWYTANMTKAEPLLYGRGLGCDFVLQSPRAWMLNKLSMSKSVEPYCLLKGNALSCDHERKALTQCSAQVFTKSLPASYQYFNGQLSVTGLQTTNLLAVGGVATADYAPTNNKFSYTDPITKAVVRDSICLHAANAKAADNNINLEYYGAGSRCINYATPWTRTMADGSRSTEVLFGAGCYRTYCVAGNQVIVDIGGKRVNCTGMGGKEVNVTVSIGTTSYAGPITCPTYADACYTPSLATTLPSTVQCASNLNCDGSSSATSHHILSWSTLMLGVAMLLGAALY